MHLFSRIYFKDDLIEYKCLCCNKNYHHKFDENLKERFFDNYKFSNHDNNKFVLVLHKGVCLCEYMDNWEKFNKTLLAEKEGFYIHLSMEDITDPDYAQAKRVCKDFKIKNLGEYHDLRVHSDTLLLEDVFENFQNICLEIYELDPAKLFFTSRISMASSLKKTKVKSNLLTNIDILSTVEKDRRRAICHSIYWYAKANNKYMKDYDKSKELSYTQYRDINSLYDWAMWQKLPLNNFVSGSKIFLYLIKKIIKNIFSKLMFNILKKYMNFIMIHHFY